MCQSELFRTNVCIDKDEQLIMLNSLVRENGSVFVRVPQEMHCVGHVGRYTCNGEQPYYLFRKELTWTLLIYRSSVSYLLHLAYVVR